MESRNFSLQFAVLLLLVFNPTNGHRILGLFPHPGLSHFHFFQPVMKALAEAGHEVTVVSHFPSDEPIENYKDESLQGATDGMKNFVNLEVSFKIFSIIWFFQFYNVFISHSGSPVPSRTIIF